ncbi:MAG: alkaline phosphatase family protein [Polyangiales bacterium]
MNNPRLLVIGLDCAPPSLVFDRFRAVMPNVQQLIGGGCHGRLRSIMPPITVPAWASMFSGRDAGELGIYGFRNRMTRDYPMTTVDARALKCKSIFDFASEQGKSVASLFVPLSSPVRPIRGVCVAGCLAKGDRRADFFPRSLGDELSGLFGEYMADIDDFRTRDRASVSRELFEMTTQHFQIATHLWKTRQPDLMAMVAIGPDRLHHLFWECFDPEHPRFVPDDPFVGIGARFYAHVDRLIGELVQHIDPHTNVMIVSDHGAKPMIGGFLINEWLRENGYLNLKSQPTSSTALNLDDVDWSSTTAWASGGYYARIWINKMLREPNGIVSPSHYEDLRDELGTRLAALGGPNNESWSNFVIRPDNHFAQTNGIAPDLMIAFDDLNWRALGSVGGPSLYTERNDTGNDGCNHDWHGIYVASGPTFDAVAEPRDASLHDVFPTIANVLNLRTPHTGHGRSLSRDQRNRD